MLMKVGLIYSLIINLMIQKLHPDVYDDLPYIVIHHIIEHAFLYYN